MLKTLESYKEAHVLSERLAKCRAAQALQGPGLSVVKIKEHLLLLQDYHHLMPFDLRCSLVSQLAIGKLDQAVELCQTDCVKAVTTLEECIASLAFDLPLVEDPGSSIPVENIDIKSPSFIPLMKEMEQKVLLDSEGGGFFGKSGGSSVPATDDDDDLFGIGNPSVKGPQDEQKAEDATRNWEAGVSTGKATEKE